MSEPSNNNSFFSTLDYNFKAFTAFFRHFNFGNFGVYFTYSAILVIGAVFIGMIWENVLAIFDKSGLLSGTEIKWMEYVEYANYSGSGRSFFILGIALFALMISKEDTSKNISLKGLLNNVNGQVLINLSISFGIILLFTLILPDTITNFYYYIYDTSWISYDYMAPKSVMKMWVDGVLHSIFTLLPYFFASLCVQLGSNKFDFSARGKILNVLAGMILLMACVNILIEFGNILSQIISGLFAVLFEDKTIKNIIALLIVSFIGIFTIGGKARILGQPDNTTYIKEPKKEDNQEVLDDIL
ncbi:MAG: hypothetical protein HUJ25_18370 [Crocinitomicaceae bacterium]|nr:hypothetical protein [Crocinitomicaceae bacterium]